MNSAYPQRQGPRLQSTSKSGLGNGLVGAAGGGGWGSGLGGGYGGGLGGGLGQAAPRPTPLSGFAQVMGGGGSQGLDMSDFPSLSGGPLPSAQSGQLNYNTVRQTLGQQQSQQTQRAPSVAPSLQGSVDGQIESRSISQQRPQEEFPALGGRQQALNGESANSALTSPTTGTQQMPLSRDASNGTFQESQTGSIGSGQQQISNGAQQASALNSAAPSSTIKRYADMTDREKYGLAGLTAAIHSRDQLASGHPESVDQTLPSAYRSNLFVGHQLENLDLDLNSPEPILDTFHVWGHNGQSSSSMFDYRDRMVVPDFTLPTAYQVGNVPAIEGRMESLSDETLFFIFFSQPRDIAQQRAAAELERRDWRWHKLLRQWLRRDTPQQNYPNSSSLVVTDLAPGIPVGTPPKARQGTTQEVGVYVFFDAPNWRRVRREFVLEHTELDHGDAGAAMSALAASAEGGFGGGALGQQQIARSWGVGAGNAGVNGMGGGIGFGGPVQAPTANAGGGTTPGGQQAGAGNQTGN
ncbi:CCR4-NOT transcription complex subunit 2-like [Teratosphaeria destructans]|uniref:CCR4-NOT transcription complex subunit 2-like n=1 Tax=Teratosphaeria destructans TaxID=418781 RepID=A0A9W7T0P5_9PEZI|nr:CCR4-NOT transcription complex subunit 2-like [Teratosphaeria destructans]